MEELYMVVKATSNEKVFESIELNLPKMRAYQKAEAYNNSGNTTLYSVIKQKTGRLIVD